MHSSDIVPIAFDAYDTTRLCGEALELTGRTMSRISTKLSSQSQWFAILRSATQCMLWLYPRSRLCPSQVYVRSLIAEPG